MQNRQEAYGAKAQGPAYSFEPGLVGYVMRAGHGLHLKHNNSDRFSDNCSVVVLYIKGEMLFLIN